MSLLLYDHSSFFSEINCGEASLCKVAPRLISAFICFLSLVAADKAPIADAAKLYWHFRQREDSGIPGVVLTCFLYAVIVFAGQRVFLPFMCVLACFLFPVTVFAGRERVYMWLHLGLCAFDNKALVHQSCG